MIKRYRKKPVEVEAIQWDGSYQNYKEIKKCFPDLKDYELVYNPENNDIWEWRIETLEGNYIVSPSDYIVKGIKGEYYPVKPDIFEETYEEVE